ncbi:MAG: hypothetical protein KUG77_15775, partial [Nannocystaceae bacterium]|nr:hypothetical protein [Nannocystaceae bacterium]
MWASDVGNTPTSPGGRLLDSPAGVPEYDDAGRVTYYDGTELEWLADGQVDTMVRQGQFGSSNIDFGYGPEGELLRRTSDSEVLSGATVATFPSASVEVWERMGLGEDLSIRRVKVGGRQVAIVEASGAISYDPDVYSFVDSEVIFPVVDRLGSTVHASDEDAVCSPDVDLSFDAWGRSGPEDWISSDPSKGALVAGGYTGHRGVLDFGLTDMGGRHYDAELRRFLSPDPVMVSPFDTQSFARYAYGRGNPNAYTDPSGYTAVPTQGPCPQGLCAGTGPGGGGLASQIAGSVAQLLSSLFGSTATGGGGGTPPAAPRHGWVTVPLEYGETGTTYTGSAPSGSWSLNSVGNVAEAGPATAAEALDAVLGWAIAGSDSRYIEAKASRMNQWSRLMAADVSNVTTGDAADLLLASGEQFVWWSTGNAASAWAGIHQVEQHLMSGEGYKVSIAFAEGVGEHLGQTVLGLQTLGVGIETGSTGLVFDGYIDAGAGAWKLAADALTFRSFFRRPGCFVAGTPVETSTGPVAIEFIQE